RRAGAGVHTQARRHRHDFSAATRQARQPYAQQRRMRAVDVRYRRVDAEPGEAEGAVAGTFAFAQALTPQREFRMRVSRSLMIATLLLVPLQAAAQSSGGSAGGGVGGSGSGSAGVTTGTAPGSTGSPSAANAPGTNSLGTAQSSGGVTTGSAAGSTAEDKKIQDENRDVDRKLKGICRGC